MKMLGVDGLDFLSKLLRWHPEERLTSQEALDHPFLRQSHTSTNRDKDDDDTTLNNREEDDIASRALISSFSSSSSSSSSSSFTSNVGASRLTSSNVFHDNVGMGSQQEPLCLSAPDASEEASTSCVTIASTPHEVVVSDKFDVGPYRYYTSYTVCHCIFISKVNFFSFH
jgi:serine/threonine protein kinase